MSGEKVLVQAKHIFIMLRPLNGSMASAAVLIGWMIGNDEVGELPISLPLLMLFTFSVVSAANIANDLSDVGTDKNAHPMRAIVSGRISRTKAQLLVAGFGITAMTTFITVMVLERSGPILSITILAMFLLSSYEAFTKRMGLLGNFTIGLSTVLPFLLGASVSELSAKVIILCPMVFTINLSRELLKDLEDIEGDRGRRRTFPLMHGTERTLHSSRISMTGAILSSFLPFLLWRPSIFYIVPIICADSIFFYALFISGKKIPKTLLLKLGMVMGLVGFISI